MKQKTADKWRLSPGAPGFTWFNFCRRCGRKIPGEETGLVRYRYPKADLYMCLSCAGKIKLTEL